MRAARKNTQQGSTAIHPFLVELKQASTEKTRLDPRAFSFSRLDYFSKPFSLGWNKRHYFQTKFGAIMTIFFFGIILAVTYRTMMEYISIENPQITTSSYMKTLPKTDLLSEVYPAFRLDYYPPTGKSYPISYMDATCNFDIYLSPMSTNPITREDWQTSLSLISACQEFPERFNKKLSTTDKRKYSNALCAQGNSSTNKSNSQTTILPEPSLIAEGNFRDCSQDDCQYFILNI
jgi:hypothetical protein